MTSNYIAGGIVHHNTGKTVAGGYEMTAHLTGEYPAWWEGKRFVRPVLAWAAGGSNEDTRDILQSELFGTVEYDDTGNRMLSGTGLIPKEFIDQAKGRIRWKRGVDDLIDTVWIRHTSGGWSRLQFKSYAQGRKSFQGTSRHVVWLDEECPEDVYEECLVRTATTGGIIILTFTPLMGLTKVVRSFLPSSYGVS